MKTAATSCPPIPLVGRTQRLIGLAIQLNNLKSSSLRLCHAADGKAVAITIPSRTPEEGHSNLLESRILQDTCSRHGIRAVGYLTMPVRE